jgi:outer membrane protein assembly factor BamB
MSGMNETPPRSGPLRPLLMGIGAGLAAVLVAVGGIFAFGKLFGGPDYGAAPGQLTASDVSGLGDGARIAPLGTLGEASTAFARFLTPSRSVIYALDERGAPRWAAPVPHADAPAEPTALFPDEDAPEQGLPELHGTPVSCAADGAALVCGDVRIDRETGEITPGEGDADETGAEGAGTDGSRPDEEAADPATAAVPLELEEDGTLLGPAGQPYPGVSLDQEGPVRMVGPVEDVQESEDAGRTGTGPWAVSDGTVLAVVSPEEVLWQRGLDAASAAVTGLGSLTAQPGWALEDDVLVLGAADAVRGLDAATGEVLWTLEVPGLTSFTVSGGQLRTVADGVFTVFGFDASTGEEQARAQPPEPGQEGGGAVLGPGREAFENATFELPPTCAAFGLHYSTEYLGEEDDGTFTGQGEFRDGTAQGSGADSYGSVVIDEVRPTRLGESPATAVSFSCFGGGAYAYPSVGIYDAGLTLLDSVEVWGDPAEGQRQDLQASAMEPAMADLGAMGPVLTFNLQGLDLYGDDSCHACGKSGSADLAYRWDGERMVHADTVFHTPSGDVRMPSQESVQAFVDAVGAGDDEAASAHATQRVMDSLEEVLGDGTAADPPTVRSVHFEGNTVGACEPVSSNATPAGMGESAFSLDEYRFHSGETLSGQPTAWEEEVRAGDVVCGVSMPDGPADEYHLYLLMRGQADGGFEVYEAGRMFG